MPQNSYLPVDMLSKLNNRNLLCDICASPNSPKAECRCAPWVWVWCGLYHNEKLDIYVDGVLEAKPDTKFS